MTKKKTSLSITDLAANADHYTSRRKINRPEYELLREQVAEFVEGRANNRHKKGLRWFLKTGMRQLNTQRVKDGLPEIRHDITENTVLRYIDRKFPDEAPLFHL
jgi:hypothetical protein